MCFTIHFLLGHMNIKITFNWIKEYLDTDATPEEMRKYLSLCGPSIEKVEKVGEDYVFEIEITSNRIDMASVVGIAQEAAAILPKFGKKAIFKQSRRRITDLKRNNFPLTIEDKDKLTNRILAVVMDGVTVGEPPAHIKYRLEAIGIRSLNSLIDITNYVMIEMGHPTHVFDYDRIKSSRLIFRMAAKGEKLVTLDGNTYSLNGSEVVIDDGTGRIVDLPGIMGTENSVVTQATKRAIFFIDNNDPSIIRKTAMEHGIRTLAATYNEKSPDPDLAKKALLRGLELFVEFVRPSSIGEIIDLYPRPSKVKEISTTARFISSRIGVSLGEDEIVNILDSLHFKVRLEGEKIKVSPPTNRASDVEIPEDIVEEVSRIYGYHNLPAIVQPSPHIKQPTDVERLFESQIKVKRFLKHLGLHEVLNYSMVSKKVINDSFLDISKHLRIKNPISQDIEYLRRYITPSLLLNISKNEGRGIHLKLFEIAKGYKPKTNDLPEEEYQMTIAVNSSLFDLKGIMEALLKEFNVSRFDLTASDHKLFHPRIQGDISIGGEWIGKFGKLNPEIKDRFGLKSDVFIVFFKFEKLIKKFRLLPTYSPPIPYATIKLDLTLETKSDLTYNELIDTAYKSSKLLQKIVFIDMYKKKITLRFYFASPDRNITEKEALKEYEIITKTLC